MLDYAHMALEELIRPQGYDCPCGRHHEAKLKYLKVAPGALKELPLAMEKLGAKKPFVVADGNTWRVAGERAVQILRDAGIDCVPYVIPCQEGRLKPGEWEAGSMLMHFDPACDLILGVGGGVINDLCKVLAHAVGAPSAIVGTAPSMDGYASDSASMEIDKVKVSLYCQVPSAILIDVDVLTQAPMRLLWAGLGDMVAKYTALCEWRFAHLIIGEYYCEGVADMMREALRKVTSSADKLAQRDPQAIQSVAEGLVIAGLAMAYAGSSRPASGLEHYFSHMWEMMALERGKEYDLHGIQVGVGTLLAMKVLGRMRNLKPTRARAEAFLAKFDQAAWEDQTRRIFGKTAPKIIEGEKTYQKNAPEGHRARMEKILENWSAIQKIIDEELPDEAWLYNLMAGTGMPLSPEDIGIPRRDVADAFLGSREIRNKYLCCSMLWDLGYMDDFAQWLLEDR